LVVDDEEESTTNSCGSTRSLFNRCKIVFVATHNGDASITQPNNPLADITLEQLPERLRAAAALAGWKALTPVQARSIPYVLAGRGMMIQARTGSGKTGAFVLPMLERLDPGQRHVQAVILVPTRELARQVWQHANTLFCGSGIESVALYGWVGYGPQIVSLRKVGVWVGGPPGS